MLEVVKCGKNEFSYWAYGKLIYNGFEVTDLFILNKEVKDGEKYKPSKIEMKRNKKQQLRFKLFL